MLPASSDVLRVLTKLRQYEGITQAKVAESGTCLARLPSVRDELERRGLHPDDWAIAAYSVVRCAIDKLVTDTGHWHILSGTLNFDQTGPPRLGVREADLRHEKLYIGKNTFDKHEERAYAALARQLVTITASPCRDDGPGQADGPDTNPITPTTMPVTANVPLFDQSGQLIQDLVLHLSIELRPAHRTALKRALVQRLTQGRTTAYRLHAIDPRAPDADERIYALLLSAILRRRYRVPMLVVPTLADVRKSAPDRHRGSSWPSLLGVLDALFTRRIGKPRLTSKQLEGILLQGKVRPNQTSGLDYHRLPSEPHLPNPEQPDYFRVRARSVHYLADLLSLAEDKGQWEEILRRPTKTKAKAIRRLTQPVRRWR